MSPLDENIKIIEDAKASMKKEIEAKGVSVPSDLHIEGYASKIDEIASGGGGTGGNLDLAGTGWLTEPSFDIDITRVSSLKSDLDYTRKKYSEWKGDKVSALRLYASNDILIYAPKIDTSKVNDMGAMFMECHYLTSVPNFNTSEVTTMSYMFQNCWKLKSAPCFDTSKVINMSNMFDTTSIEVVPCFNTSKVQDMSNMFRNCTLLNSVPGFDTREVENMIAMFYNCRILTAIPKLNAGKVTNASGMLDFCPALIDLGGFEDLKASINLSWSSNLTHRSLMNVINNLGKVVYKQTLTLGSVNLAKLTPEEIKIGTDKGWKIIA